MCDAGEWRHGRSHTLLVRGWREELPPPIWKSSQALSIDMKNSYFSLNSAVLLGGIYPMERKHIDTQVLITALLVEV